MHVAQVVCTDAFAGVERYVATLAGGLAGEGCEVTVVGGEHGRMVAELDGTGVAVVPARTVASAVRALVDRGPFDVVHVHMTAAELAGVVATARSRTPVVATRHFAARRGSSAPARLLGRSVARRIRAQLAIGDYVAARIEGTSVVVAPGMATVHEPAGAATRDPVVLVAQRFEPEKRTDLAVEAWARSGLASLGWSLELAGDGAERAALESLAARLGVGASCRFLGARRDLAERLGRASILLAPRSDEPFGLSVVEAMAAGLPVVAGAGGGHDETVGRCEGAALFPAGDAGAAGTLLAGLAADPARRDRYGRALRDVQREHFTVARQVAGTLAVYRSVT